LNDAFLLSKAAISLSISVFVRGVTGDTFARARFFLRVQTLFTQFLE